MKPVLIAIAFSLVLLSASPALSEPCLFQKGCFLAWGVGSPPARIAEPGRAAAMAERAARSVAMKNLLACMERQGRKPPGEAAFSGTLPPWVRVAGVARLADGSVMVTLSYCP